MRAALLAAALVVGAGCIGAPSSVAQNDSEALSPSLGSAAASTISVSLPAGASHVLLRVSSGAGTPYDIEFAIPPGDPDSYVNLLLYRIDGALLRWDVGFMGPAEDGGPFRFTVDGGDRFVVAAVHTTLGSSLRVDLSDEETSVLATGVGPASLSAYHVWSPDELNPSEVFLREVEVESLHFVNANSISASTVEVGSRHSYPEDSVTFGAIFLGGRAATASSAIEWDPYGELRHELIPIVRPLKGAAVIGVHAGNGETALSFEWKGATVGESTYFDHLTVPFDSDAQGFAVEPLWLSGIGAVAYPIGRGMYAGSFGSSTTYATR